MAGMCSNLDDFGNDAPGTKHTANARNDILNADAHDQKTDNPRDRVEACHPDQFEKAR